MGQRAVGAVWARHMVVKGLSVMVVWEWWVMKWVRQRDFRGV